MITTYNKISYFGFNFDWKSTSYFKGFTIKLLINNFGRKGNSNFPAPLKHKQKMKRCFQKLATNH